MASAIPPVLIELQADVAGLKAGLQKAQDAIKGIDTSVSTASTGMTNFMTKIKQVGTTMGVAFAGTQIVQFGKDTIMAASSMAESVSKVKVVFGESADAVFKFGDNAAKSMGMSNQAAIEAAGTYGNLFQAFGIGQGKANEMSTTLVQLAADLGSFNNTSTEEAINALRSGLSGETEPLKRYGVALNEATLKAKAMAMGFGEIKGAMDPAIKAQVTYALVLEQTKLAQGDYERTAGGTANKMKSLQAEFQNAKVAVGDMLMPAFTAILAVLKAVIPIITGLTKFFKENSDALKMYAIILGTAAAAFYGYRAAIVATRVAQQLYVVVTTLMRGATLASIASTNGLAASMLMLNAAMRANPVGLIVTGLMILGAAFVWAWKKSETFRGIVIKGVQIILNWWALLIDGVGKFIGLLGKVPGMGWAKGIADGAKKASEALKTTSKNLADLKKENTGYGEGAFTYGSGKGTGTSEDTGVTGGGTSAADAAKAAKQRVKDIEKANKEIAKIYEKMNDVIEADGKARVKAAEKRDKAIADTTKKYADLEQKIIDKKNEDLQKNEDNWNKAYAKAREDRRKRDAEIEKDYAAKILEINKAAENKIADVRKAGAEKQASIVQQSIDRLRNAFASGTAANISQIFKDGAKTADDVITQLKDKLQASKELQKNAALLQAAGYSQVFIEEVVAAGPQVGNEMAKALLSASTDTQTQLKDLYGQVNTLSETGLDQLAATMNSGGKLATSQLMAAFKQVAIDVNESILEINDDLKENLAKANADYLEKMADSKAILEEALAAADAALAEANKSTMDEFNKAMKENAELLAEALKEIQTDYEDAIAAIAASTKEKLAELQADLVAAAAALKKLGETKAAAAAIANSPALTYTAPTIKTDASVSSTFKTPQTAKDVAMINYNYNTNVTGVNMSDPNAAAKVVDNTLRFGAPQSLTRAGLVYAE
jgi:hypothetical protein